MSATLAAMCWMSIGFGVDRGEPAEAPRVLLVDLNGDGAPDLLTCREDGRIEVSLNEGRRQFVPVPQELPLVALTSVLTSDLDRDGHLDLYLVARGSNLALLGDGSGHFRDATSQLGLDDEAHGVAAARFDVDGDGLEDVVLTNVDSQVIFWAEPHGVFLRALETPRLTWPDASSVISSTGATPVEDAQAAGAAAAARAMAAPRGAGGRGARAAVAGAQPLSTAGGGAALLTSGAWPPSFDKLLTVLDSRYVNDDAQQVDGLDVVPGSLSGSQVSSAQGDVTITGGALGVGTVVPARRLHVTGSSLGADRTVALFENTADGTSGFNTGGIQVVSGGTQTELVSIGQAYDALAGWAGFSSLTGQGSGVQLAAVATNGVVRFLTGGQQSERMRITAAGRVGIGTSNPQATQQIVGGPQWSSWNYGADLLLSGTRHNALGILSSTGSSPWAIANTGAGTLTFAAMPPLGNTTAAPDRRLLLEPTGATLYGEFRATQGVRLPDGTLLTGATSQGPQGDPGPAGAPGAPGGLILQFKGLGEPNLPPQAVGALWINTDGEDDDPDYWTVYLGLGTTSALEWWEIY